MRYGLQWIGFFSWTTSNLVLWDTLYCLVLALFVYCYIMKDKLFVLTFFFSLSNTHGHKNYACTIPAITMHILILHILGVWKILPFISKIKTIFRTPNVRVINMKKLITWKKTTAGLLYTQLSVHSYSFFWALRFSISSLKWKLQRKLFKTSANKGIGQFFSRTTCCSTEKFLFGHL